MLPTPIVPNPDYNLVYEPAEDTFLFLDLFEQLHDDHYFLPTTNPFKTIVELGTGSGLISTFIASNKIIPNSFNIATDININALKTTINTFNHNTTTTSTSSSSTPSPLLFDTIRCNLTDPFLKNKIDVLIFNPPYVPSEEIPPIPSSSDDNNDSWLDLALVGGDDGMLITNKVLDSLDSVLSPNGGEAYILFCARNNHPKVIQNFKKSYPNFTISLLIQRKCGWEELAIYRFIKTV